MSTENPGAADQDRDATYEEIAAELRHLQDRLIVAHQLLSASRFDSRNKVGLTRERYRDAKKGWFQDTSGPVRIWVQIRREALAKERAEAEALRRYEEEQDRDRR